MQDDVRQPSVHALHQPTVSFSDLRDLVYDKLVVAGYPIVSGFPSEIVEMDRGALQYVAKLTSEPRLSGATITENQGPAQIGGRYRVQMRSLPVIVEPPHFVCRQGRS